MNDHLNVTTAALVDLQAQREAFEMRRKTLDIANALAPEAYEPGDVNIPTEVFEHLVRPVRIEVDLSDPIHIRDQMLVLQSAAQEVIDICRDHTRGRNRQRLHAHTVLRTCADTLSMLNGKTPAGKRRRKMEEFHRILDEQERK